ncbi:MAG: hypothetical protein KDA42_07155, partial [Planctomycetales bacterium]|nr:hypothetical protein [Planctomycetales bacterium]
MSIDARNEAKERVREAVDIVDLVGSYLPLRNQGRDMVGLCPWHDDSRPSLRVSPERQSYKCFVCDLGGDIFSFVQQIEGVTFPEALELLAERAGIVLPKSGQASTPEKSSEKKLLLAAMDWATQQYHRFLIEGRDAEIAREYLRGRHISDESLARFRIGYAPNEWDWLLQRAAGTPYTPAVLEKVGLLKRRSSGDGYYDAYRGRVLFTIRDCSNREARPIALGGRILPEFSDDATPKYINSPDTPLFSKNRQLYGFDQARQR